MLNRADRRRQIVAVIGAVFAVAALSSKQAEAAFDAHGGPVKGVTVSKDGQHALTASFDYKIILWSLDDQSVVWELQGHDAAVNTVAFLPGGDLALSASDDGTVGVWDLGSGQATAFLKAHTGKAVAVAVSPDGRLAASAGWDRTVLVWDLDGLKEQGLEGVLKQPVSSRSFTSADNPNALAFSPDGSQLFVGASDGSVAVWHVQEGTRVASWHAHEFAVTSLVASTDGQIIATSSIDETVQLWQAATGKRLETLFGHQGPVLAVSLSADGQLVASGGVDGTVRLWRRGDGDRLKSYARHQGPVWSVAFTPDGQNLLSGGADGLVFTYDLDSKEDEDSVSAVAVDDTATRPIGETPPSAMDGRFDRGQELFKTCVACHTTGPDDGNKAGPTLHGLFGRKVGSHPDYRYSEALEQSSLIWTEETVDRLFDIGPDRLLPGTKMPLQRLPDDQDRADLITFLRRVTEP